ncbi:hypothetical protein C5S39_00075 [Candidatus Methanophagaceae archaeon]|jgi:hypothetical protein|nr:hypothetical protein C5S39_00075 [Methanophagales archaeon]
MTYFAMPARLNGVLYLHESKKVYTLCLYLYSHRFALIPSRALPPTDAFEFISVQDLSSIRLIIFCHGIAKKKMLLKL